MPRHKQGEEEEIIMEFSEKEISTDSPIEEVQEVKVKKEKKNPKLATETVFVCKDEAGNGGCPVEGIVAKDGKSVTTSEGVTFAI